MADELDAIGVNIYANVDVLVRSIEKADEEIGQLQNRTKQKTARLGIGWKSGAIAAMDQEIDALAAKDREILVNIKWQPTAARKGQFQRDIQKALNAGDPPKIKTSLDLEPKAIATMRQKIQNALAHIPIEDVELYGKWMGWAPNGAPGVVEVPVKGVSTGPATKQPAAEKAAEHVAPLKDTGGQWLGGGRVLKVFVTNMPGGGFGGGGEPPGGGGPPPNAGMQPSAVLDQPATQTTKTSETTGGKAGTTRETTETTTTKKTKETQPAAAEDKTSTVIKGTPITPVNVTPSAGPVGKKVTQLVEGAAQGAPVLMGRHAGGGSDIMSAQLLDIVEEQAEIAQRTPEVMKQFLKEFGITLKAGTVTDSRPRSQPKMGDLQEQNPTPERTYPVIEADFSKMKLPRKRSGGTLGMMSNLGIDPTMKRNDILKLVEERLSTAIEAYNQEYGPQMTDEDILASFFGEGARPEPEGALRPGKKGMGIANPKSAFKFLGGTGSRLTQEQVRARNAMNQIMLDLARGEQVSPEDAAGILAHENRSAYGFLNEEGELSPEANKAIGERKAAARAVKELKEQLEAGLDPFDLQVGTIDTLTNMFVSGQRTVGEGENELDTREGALRAVDELQGIFHRMEQDDPGFKQVLRRVRQGKPKNTAFDRSVERAVSAMSTATTVLGRNIALDPNDPEGIKAAAGGSVDRLAGQELDEISANQARAQSTVMNRLLEQFIDIKNPKTGQPFGLPAINTSDPTAAAVASDIQKTILKRKQIREGMKSGKKLIKDEDPSLDELMPDAERSRLQSEIATLEGNERTTRSKTKKTDLQQQIAAKKAELTKVLQARPPRTLRQHIEELELPQMPTMPASVVNALAKGKISEIFRTSPDWDAAWTDFIRAHEEDFESAEERSSAAPKRKMRKEAVLDPIQIQARRTEVMDLLKSATGDKEDELRAELRFLNGALETGPIADLTKKRDKLSAELYGIPAKGDNEAVLGAIGTSREGEVRQLLDYANADLLEAEAAELEKPATSVNRLNTGALEAAAAKRARALELREKHAISNAPLPDFLQSFLGEEEIEVDPADVERRRARLRAEEAGKPTPKPKTTKKKPKAAPQPKVEDEEALPQGAREFVTTAEDHIETTGLPRDLVAEIEAAADEVNAVLAIANKGGAAGRGSDKKFNARRQAAMQAWTDLKARATGPSVADVVMADDEQIDAMFKEQFGDIDEMAEYRQLRAAMGETKANALEEGVHGLRPLPPYASLSKDDDRFIELFQKHFVDDPDELLGEGPGTPAARPGRDPRLTTGTAKGRFRSMMAELEGITSPQMAAGILNPRRTKDTSVAQASAALMYQQGFRAVGGQLLGGPGAGGGGIQKVHVVNFAELKAMWAQAAPGAGGGAAEARAAQPYATLDEETEVPPGVRPSAYRAAMGQMPEPADDEEDFFSLANQRLYDQQISDTREFFKQREELITSRSPTVALGEAFQALIGGRPELVTAIQEAKALNTRRATLITQSQRILQRQLPKLDAEEADINADTALSDAQRKASLKRTARKRISLLRDLQLNEAEVKDLDTKIAEDRETIDKFNPVLRSFTTLTAGAIGGTLIFGATLTAAQALIQAVTQAVAPSVDALFGYMGTAQRVNGVIADSIRQQGGYTDVVVANTLAQAGFRKETVSSIQPLLEQTSSIAAGNRALAEQIDLVKTVRAFQQPTFGEGVRGLTASTGGVFGINAEPGQFEQLGKLLPGADDFDHFIGTLENFGIGPFNAGGLGELARFGLERAGENLEGNLVAGLGLEPTSAEQRRQQKVDDETLKLLNQGNTQIQFIRLDDVGDQQMRDAIHDATVQAYDESEVPASDRRAFERARLGLVRQTAEGPVPVAGGRDLLSFLAISARNRTLADPQLLLEALAAKELPAQRQIFREQSLLEKRLAPIQFALQTLTAPILPAGVGVPQGITVGGLQNRQFQAGTAGLAQQQLALREQGLQGLLETVRPDRVGAVEDQLRGIMNLSDQLAGMQVEIISMNQVHTVNTLNEQLRLTRLNVRDLAGLTGQQGGSAFGGMQRDLLMANRELQRLGLESSRISIGISERQLNLQEALAGLGVAGETPEERALRLKATREELADQRKLLENQKDALTIQEGIVPISFKVEDIANDRNYVAAKKQLDLLKEQIRVTVRTAELEDRMTRVASLIQYQVGLVQSDLQEGIQDITLETQTYAGVVQQSAEDWRKTRGYVRDIFDILRGGSGGSRDGGSSPTNEDVVGDFNPTFASGGLFNTAGPLGITVGEAGKETVAVLRNPRSMFANLGMAGGISLNINVTGNTVRSQADLDELVRRITNEVQYAMAQQSALRGLRQPV